MLIRELIVRHAGVTGAIHERDIELSPTQVPPGLRVHRSTEDAVAPVAGDLVIASAPVGSGLREHLDSDLPVGTNVVLLLEVEPSELPVGRVLAALAVAKLQVVEAVVVSGTAAAMVAVVATRTDELVSPQPYLAHELEPGDHRGPAVLRRILGEHALEGLVQRARERAIWAQVDATAARLGEVTTELEKLQADQLEREATVRDLDKARRDADTECRTLARALETARKQTETERKRMQQLRSSNSFKVASRLARISGFARRIARQPAHGKARG
jgi:hypothetical protein